MCCIIDCSFSYLRFWLPSCIYLKLAMQYAKLTCSLYIGCYLAVISFQIYWNNAVQFVTKTVVGESNFADTQSISPKGTTSKTGKTSFDIDICI